VQRLASAGPFSLRNIPFSADALAFPDIQIAEINVCLEGLMAEPASPLPFWAIAAVLKFSAGESSNRNK
jgi:hypothetical protein